MRRILFVHADSGVPGRKLLFYVTEDWYFVSHRMPLALAAQAAGYDVSVVTRVRDHKAAIRQAGLRLIPFENSRTGVNPLAELLTVLRLIRLYRHERPAIVHHVAMKPVLYCSIAASFAGRPRIINALAGMGWIFTAREGGARWLKLIVRWALRRVLPTGVVLVQNPDDAQLMADLGVAASQIVVIPGSGVDLTKFRPLPEPVSIPTVVLPARLLWDKGVGEFVAAARSLRRQGIQARFILAGLPDAANPAAVPPVLIRKWVDEGVIEHLGWVEDMPRLLAESHIVCLPSYREGAPKALIEAAAAGRPIVTTDVPGCRHVVTHGDNGLLVPARNADLLGEAIATLIGDPELRRRMGARGRSRAERDFGLDRVIEEVLALYAAGGQPSLRYI